MGWLKAFDEFVRANDIRVNFLVNCGIVVGMVWACGFAFYKRAKRAIDSAFVRDYGVKSVQAVGIVAISILIGWRCGLGADERNQAREREALQGEGNGNPERQPDRRERQPLFQFRKSTVE